jgi:myosin heavy subunit
MCIQDHPQQESIVQELAATVEQLQEKVDEQAEQIDELEEIVREQSEEIERQSEEIERQSEEIKRQAKESAEDRRRITTVEEQVEEIEKTKSSDANPTPEASESANRKPLTPIERLSRGDRADIAEQVTPSVKRALTLFENLPKWGTSTPKGITLRPADKPKDLLEAATGESLAWQQYYRAAEALESLSKGAVTFFDHQKHGKMLVLHDDSDVQRRLSETTADSSQVSLAAD